MQLRLTCLYYIISPSNKANRRKMFLKNLHFILCSVSIYTIDSKRKFENLYSKPPIQKNKLIFTVFLTLQFKI